MVAGILLRPWNHDKKAKSHCSLYSVKVKPTIRRVTSDECESTLLLVLSLGDVIVRCEMRAMKGERRDEIRGDNKDSMSFVGNSRFLGIELVFFLRFMTNSQIFPRFMTKSQSLIPERQFDSKYSTYRTTCFRVCRNFSSFNCRRQFPTRVEGDACTYEHDAPHRYV